MKRYLIILCSFFMTSSVMAYTGQNLLVTEPVKLTADTLSIDPTSTGTFKIIQVTSNTILAGTTIYPYGYIVTNSTMSATNYAGGGLATCGDDTHALAFSAATGKFSCQTITVAPGTGDNLGNGTGSHGVDTTTGSFSGIFSVGSTATIANVTLSTSIFVEPTYTNRSTGVIIASSLNIQPGAGQGLCAVNLWDKYGSLKTASNVLGEWDFNNVLRVNCPVGECLDADPSDGGARGITFRNYSDVPNNFATIELKNGAGGDSAQIHMVNVSTAGLFGGPIQRQGRLLFYTADAVTGFDLERMRIDENGKTTIGVLQISSNTFHPGTTFYQNGQAVINGVNSSSWLTGNQSITLSGDMSGTGTTAITTTANGLQSNIKTFTSSITVTGIGGIRISQGVSASTVSISSTSFIAGSTFTYTDKGNLGIGKIVWSDGTIQVSSPVAGGAGTPNGTSFNVQVSSVGAFAGVSDFNVNRDSITIGGALHYVQIATNTILGPTTFYNDGRAVGIALGVAAHNAGTGATSSTYLRGDNTWATPSAVAAPGGPNYNVQISSNTAIAGASGFNVNPSSIVISNAYETYTSTLNVSSSFTVVGVGDVNLNGVTLTLPPQNTPTTRNNGSIWNDSNYNAFISSVNATLQNIPTTLFTISAASNTNTTATRVDWLGTGNTKGTINLPPNFWTVGKTIYIVLIGTQTRTSTPTLLPSISLGGTVILSTGAIALGAYTAETPGRGWTLFAELTCYSTGATGRISGAGLLEFVGSIAVHSAYTLKDQGNTVNTTLPMALQFSTTWGASSSANSITLMGGHATVHY